VVITIAGREYEVIYTTNAFEISQALSTSKPTFFTFDTETTGLHIKKDRPFLAGVCFGNVVYIFPAIAEILRFLFVWSTLVRRVYGHNVTYDMHMVANIMGDKFPLQIKNWGDTMGLCRLTFEAISARDGGDKLGLKEVGKKYIDKNADRYEKDVKAWLKAKEAANRKLLIALLAGIKDEGGKWSMKRFQSALDDGTLPEAVLNVYNEWRQHYPKPTYQDVPLDLMIPYLAVDVILTQMLVEKAGPVIAFRKQGKTIDREFRVLPVVYKMERAGIKVNRDYLQECGKKMEEYIQKLYVKLHLLSGSEFTVGQHKRIREIYTELLGEEPESTDKKFLKKMADKGDESAALISRLRRLEKWLKTYIERILEVSAYDGRFYTSMNQFNPVSGRFSGDAQQFPKDPIYTEEGYEFERQHPNQHVPEEMVLYHPRRAFEGRMYYLDYSQVELRVQGHYTLYFGGDVNLCRAYMPYRCTHYESNEEYDYRTVVGRSRWGELRKGAPAGLHWEEALEKGWSAWTNPDTGKPWVPTDVHMATTLKALVAMGLNPDEMEKDVVKWWRKKGKTFNFMRNYGGGDQKASETLDITLEQAKAMNKGYTDAFPVVVVYQDQVVSSARQQGYVANMSGRRYYLSNWNKHYKLANYLIQGSCADMLKEKMIEIDEFIVKNDLDEQVVMELCVHDELQFEVAEGADWAIAEIKRIMEDAPDIMVPIVAEVEFTETNWAEKKKVVA
jgi:DNA polymerase-1